MRIQILLLSVLLLATGCTHQRVVAPADVDSVVDLNQRAGQHNVTVTLANGAVYDGRALQMAADSTSWLVDDTQEVKRVATSDVVKVEVLDRGRGALRGAAKGGLAGGLLGATTLLLVSSCSDCLFEDAGVGDALALGAVYGLYMGFGGLVVGAILGSKDVYMIEAAMETGHAVEDWRRGGGEGRVSSRCEKARLIV